MIAEAQPASRLYLRLIGFLFRLGKCGDLGLHFFAGLEYDNALGRNLDGFARSGITSLSWFTASDFKNAEITKLDPSVLDKRFDYCVESFLDDLRRLVFWHGELVGNGEDNIPFGHLLI